MDTPASRAMSAIVGRFKLILPGAQANTVKYLSTPDRPPRVAYPVSQPLGRWMTRFIDH
ncbi:hypothetical protein Raf01_08600 [Rugosimonospora africana]|uniref:Uncharacterized protein n=1 Tax=Rugosimonospora africana TaxID=556532 RepID=A0A8J3VNY0_9ACTN|nr:hypothetical protein Raf01_08600 [Rugosimonospora africana]